MNELPPIDTFSMVLGFGIGLAISFAINAGSVLIWYVLTEKKSQKRLKPYKRPAL